MLDKGKTGFINFAQFASYIVLLGSTLPTAKELSEYDIKLAVVTQGECIQAIDFPKVEAWFDLSEDCAQREKAEKFERVKMVKELLFAINKDPEKVRFKYINIHIECVE